MAKAKSVYTCTECGGQAPKWQGQCPHCEAWNTLIETAVEQGKGIALISAFLRCAFAEGVNLNRERGLRRVVEQSTARSAVYDIVTNGVPVIIEVEAG